MIGAAGEEGVRRALAHLGFWREGARLTPLAGGVSSDIFRLDRLGQAPLAVKRSLGRLRVAAEWRAPANREAIEAAWLNAVREVDSRLAPEVVAVSPPDKLIVLAWIEGPPWKDEMAAGRIDPTFATAVGAALARLHAAFATRADIVRRFPRREVFEALRVEPFFGHAAKAHPDLGQRITELGRQVLARPATLIWGDASPKNMLVGRQGPVFLDAETAVIGDPAFDLAFCLTHLVLKSVWLAPRAARVMAALEALKGAYLAGAFEPPEDLSRRAAAFVGALLLARVDGKSPAPYLDEAQRTLIRARARVLVAAGDMELDELTARWRAFQVNQPASVGKRAGA